MNEHGSSSHSGPDTAANNGLLDNQDDGLDILMFSINNIRWGIEARYVTEVRANAKITPLPGTEKFVTGLIDLKGYILPVFNLGDLLGFTANSNTPQTSIIVLGEKSSEFALCINENLSFVRMGAEEINCDETEYFPEPQWVLGHTSDKVTILDGEALLKDRSFSIGH